MAAGQTNGLIARIQAIVRRGRPTPPPTTSDAPETLRASSQQNTVELLGAFQVETTRAGIVNGCRDMYASDPRIRRIHKTLAEDGISGGFTIKVSNNAKAQKSAEDLSKRLKFNTALVNWLRLTLRDGDSFLEASVSAAREVTRITRKPTLNMRRNSNKYDTFDDPERAFWWAQNTFDALPPSDALYFAEWQIIHARWDHDEGTRYGSPLFASAATAYKRVREGELDIAVRRKTRAGMRYLHVVEDEDDNAIEAYKETNKAALDNPLVAVADFFSNKAGSISTIQGDQRLGEILDIIHHIDTMFTASPIPMSLISYGKDLNRDVLEKQKDQYDSTLPNINSWVEDQIVKPILELQWLLDGILPDGLNYEIEWNPKATVSGKDLKFIADAVLALKAIGFDDEALISILQRYMPTVDVRATLGNSLKRRQESPEVLAAAALPPKETIKNAGQPVPPQPAAPQTIKSTR